MRMIRTPPPEESTICLRMKAGKVPARTGSCNVSPCSPFHPVSDDGESTDRLLGMARKDLQYTCEDYLSRAFHQTGGGVTHLGIDSCSFQDCEEPIDGVCREKMVDWAFRVSDHFQTSREIVSYAFSFLDRFVSRCSCDRTAFKLASMTSLYMATKLFNPKQISIQSLSDLSRGEFTTAHIAEMERVILTTLDWKLNPPTIQSFIDSIHPYLPVADRGLLHAVYQRAVFFSELAMYDYQLVLESRLNLAIACILNAMEGIDDSPESRHTQLEFVRDLTAAMGIEVGMDAIDRMQGRLWFLYSCSAQLLDDDAFTHQTSKHPVASKGATTGMECFAHSPVSVRQTRHY